MILVVRESIRLREEPFGSFIYFRRSQKVARLSHIETIIVKAFSTPRNKNQVIKLASKYLQSPRNKIMDIIGKLESSFILTSTNDKGTQLSLGEWERLCQEQEIVSANKPFSSPVWMHIQPWTVCNLTCKHCYCFASPNGNPSHLTEDKWLQLIDEFAEMNVFELFITGGEVFIDNRFWTIGAYARKKDMVIRTTTNGTFIKQDTPDRLVDELGIDKIQVSLDGGSSKTHDPFRGRNGAFEQTIEGIKRLRKRLEVSLEVTIHRNNAHEVNDIIKLASDLGCCEVKFVNIFPTGRAYGIFQHYQLSEVQKGMLVNKYQELQQKYPDIHINYGSNCNDITQKDSTVCTAGVIGANVDEKGNVLPCIMGISVESLYAGNVLEKTFSEIWYHSPLLKRMRNLPDKPGLSCGTCSWRSECKSRCSVIAHQTAQAPCHLSPKNPQSHFNIPLVVEKL